MSDNKGGGIYQLGNHPDGVRAICKECESVVLKENESEAWEVVERHNKQQHDGEGVAGICEWDVPDLPSFSELAENVGLGEALSIAEGIGNKNADTNHD